MANTTSALPLRRRARSKLMMGLSIGSALLGLVMLAIILGTLLYKGVATRAFRFDPVTGIPGRERKALADKQARRRAELVKTLQSGALELAEVRRQVLAWRDVIGKAYREQWGKLAELKAHAVWELTPATSGSAGSSGSSAGQSRGA